MKTIRLQPSGKEVACEDGETVLSALEKNGYALPNNCRAGACGECKIKVKSGEYDQGFILHMALSEEEKKEGYGLMCMAKVTSEVLEIEWATENAGPKLFPPKENMPYVVTEKSMATPDIVKLRLRPLGNSMQFWPGQYVTLGDETKGIPKRCYSIANIFNSEGEVLLYITKVNEGKASVWIHDDIKAGDPIKVSGPYGTFVGDPSLETPVLCLAAGSGLAPIESLASAALLRGGFRQPATILFSAKTKDDLFDLGMFSYLESKFRNFEFKYTLTREENKDGLFGRIPDILPELYPDLSKFSVYIAGSPDFVESCKKVVKELGTTNDHIFSEGFFGQKDPETPPKDQLM
jgi:CDP-4-dehydro-6-deoxyglucose reductase, E3